MKINIEKEALMIANATSDIKIFFDNGSAKVSMLDENKNPVMDIEWDTSREKNRGYYKVNDDKQYILFRLEEMIRDHRTFFLMTEGEESLRFLVKNIEDGSESAIEILGRGQENNAVQIKKEDEESDIWLEFMHIDMGTPANESENNEMNENMIRNNLFQNMSLKDVEEKIIHEDIPLITYYADATQTETIEVKNSLELLQEEIKQETDGGKEERKEEFITRFFDIEKRIFENLYKMRKGKIERVRENV